MKATACLVPLLPFTSLALLSSECHMAHPFPLQKDVRGPGGNGPEAGTLVLVRM